MEAVGQAFSALEAKVSSSVEETGERYTSVMGFNVKKDPPQLKDSDPDFKKTEEGNARNKREEANRKAEDEE